MRFDEIDDLKPLILAGDPGKEFTGISCDSRLTRRGDLFAAVPGWREDGSKYIESALERGAVGIITEQPLQNIRGGCLQVTDVRLALAMIAAAVNNYPAREMDVFSVTGTNGKTTTAWILSDMLKASGRSSGLLTTVVIEYAGREIPVRRTTPDACTLQRILADMRCQGCDSVVLESSSHALHQRRVAGIPFAGGIFTNLSQDHLDYHQTMEDYFAAKLMMFQQMADLNPGAPAICCIDSEYGLRMVRAAQDLALTCVTVGFSADAHLRASSLKACADGSEFILNGCGAQELRVHTGLAGAHNVLNLICAGACAAASGVSWNVIARSMESAQPKWGRLERVQLAGAEFSAFVDYAHTDDALKNVLASLRDITEGRLIVVFGCGGDRDTTKRPLMGKVCVELADQAIVTSDNPRNEDPDAIINEILAGIDDQEGVIVRSDRREAIRAALQMARSGDVLLVAGKGHECFQECLGRSVPFDDRKVLQEEAAALKDKRMNFAD